MNKVTYQNPANPRETIATANPQTARRLKSQGWREVEAVIVTAKAGKK